VILEKPWHLVRKILQKKTGVSRQTINAIENGKFDPSLGLVFKLIDVLGKPLDEIFIND
jgi:putative transcriptional regulator